jgi:glucosamine--fructose-6-phosphate aminotransferase (isomerizing)
MGVTEQTIFEQFPYWQKAAATPFAPLPDAEVTVFVGCGTSYNLAMSLASLANASGRPAIAAPGGEWTSRAGHYWGKPGVAHVVALSRSGETTETVAAAKASRAAGLFVTAITVEASSSLAQNSDRVVASPTDGREGIVMTTSASLMLLLGMVLIGHPVTSEAIALSEAVLHEVDLKVPAFLAGREHFVFLGGGANYGVAVEGSLKLMEMSQSFTQAFHPLEYRHGPISLIDGGSVAVILYSADQREAEARLVDELRAKGALVIGLGGDGDVALDVPTEPTLASLVYLPALQLIGERVAQSRNLDTAAPRHLTKVVTLA